MTVTENQIAETGNGAAKDGRVTTIAGPVVDIEFPPDAVPAINNALEMTVTVDGVETPIQAEVAQQLGGSRLPCGPHHRAKHHRIGMLNRHGTVGQLGQGPGFDGELLAADLPLNSYRLPLYSFAASDE
jgi:hypothetical protein